MCSVSRAVPHRLVARLLYASAAPVWFVKLDKHLTWVTDFKFASKVMYRVQGYNISCFQTGGVNEFQMYLIDVVITYVTCNYRFQSICETPWRPSGRRVMDCLMLKLQPPSSHNAECCYTHASSWRNNDDYSPTDYILLMNVNKCKLKMKSIHIPWNISGFQLY